MTKLYVQSLTGCFEYSKLHEGDFLAFINDKPAPHDDPELAARQMKRALREDGYLWVSVENPEGSDILMQSTVIKPRPNMTYQEMGMIVWYWGFLRIRTIGKDSIFYSTVLKEGDHITAINDIETADMTIEQVAHVLSTLTHEITLTILRRKQRVSGNYN